MGAAPFVPPRVVIRYVEPHAIDPVVVAAGGMARVAQRIEDAAHLLAAVGAEFDPARGARYPDQVAAGRELLAAIRQQAALRQAAARASIATSRARRAGAKASTTSTAA